MNIGQTSLYLNDANSFSYGYCKTLKSRVET